MTTDNRMNEPAPEQVEAAAKAFYETPLGLTNWDRMADVEPDLARRYREGMARALVAAQGAAPQAESKCQTCSREASFCAHCVAEMELAPVLPSSGVERDPLCSDDRKMLASVFQQHCELPDGGLSDDFYEAVIAVANVGYERGIEHLPSSTAPQASKKSCGPCRRGQHGCCDGNEYLRCECSHDAAPVLPSSGVDETREGK